MKEFNAKKKTAFIIVNILMSILLIMSTMITIVLALEKFTLNMGGNISFQAKDVQATISDGEILGGDIVDKENKMQAIILTPENDGSVEMSSWSGLEISFAGKEDVTITFTVTNNHAEEALLFTANVNEGTKNNMTMSMKIDGENKTETVIPANSGSNDNSVECVVTFHVEESSQSANITDFGIGCELEVVEGGNVKLSYKAFEESAYMYLGVSINGGEFNRYADGISDETVLLEDVYTLQFATKGDWYKAPAPLMGGEQFVIKGDGVDILLNLENVEYSEVIKVSGDMVLEITGQFKDIGGIV